MITQVSMNGAFIALKSTWIKIKNSMDVYELCPC